MSTLSVPTRCLLDKNIVRYAIAGLHCGPLRKLSSLEAGTLSFWRAAETHTQLFISGVTLHTLQRIGMYNEIQVLLDAVEVMWPTRYQARWARRIRETTGLSREDTNLIALCSFGTTQAGDILGVHQLITYDQPMINGYLNHLPVLRNRFQAMTVQLSPPFRQTTLPQLITPVAWVDHIS
jgi:hypothetical protein